ncbi:MAG: LAGLIDADG family homing endonuclease [Candidatus Diapherotrites archaeon]
MASISLFDLPAGKIRVTLDAEFRKELFGALLKKHGSFSAIARAFGLGRGESARRYSVGRSGMPLSFLARAADELGINGRKIEKKVIELKTLKSKEKIKNPKLPFEILTEEFGLVVGGVLGDGGIEKSKMRVWYFNNERQQVDSFVGAVVSTFGDVRFARHRSTSGVPCVIFPKIIGVILGTIGIPDGNKNYNYELGIPRQFIAAGDRKPLIALLRRLFDDDGCVVDNYHCRVITLICPTTAAEETAAKKPQLLSDVQQSLEVMGIKSKIVVRGRNFKSSGEVTLNWTLIISGRENLRKYLEKVGFGLERKENKLVHVLGRYVDGLESFPRHEASENYIKAITNLNAQGVLATASGISKACKRSGRHVRDVLLRMSEEGLVERKLTGNKFAYCVAGGA